MYIASTALALSSALPAALAVAGATLLETTATALSAVSATAGVTTLSRWQCFAMPRSLRSGPRRNERGEGVISAAIAVLIIASLGALMWVGFKALWENAEETTNSEIAKIGK